MGLLRKINKIIFINFGGRKEKLLFLFIFSTYLPMFLLKFWSGELIGCGIWFHIQQVPTLHTFNGPLYPKKINTWEKKTWRWHHHHVFQVFLVFGVAGSVKSVPSGYSLDVEFNSQKQEIPKKRDDDVIIMFFQVFLVFGVAASIKSMPSGYLLDVEFNFASNKLS